MISYFVVDWMLHKDEIILISRAGKFLSLTVNYLMVSRGRMILNITERVCT